MQPEDAAGAREEEALPRVLAYAALFSSLSGIFMLSGLAFLRSGLPTPPLLMPYCAALLVAVAFSPFLFPAGRPVSAAALAALCLPLLGFLHPGLAIVAVGGVAILGLLRGMRWLRAIPGYGKLFLLAGPPLVALHAFPADGLMFVYAAETAPYGLLDNATYFQTAVTHILQLHRVPSIGADGLQLIHYHFGSHFWFAGIALATGSTPLHAYPPAQLAVLVPLLYFALFAAAGELARSDRRAPMLVIVCAGMVALFDSVILRIHYSSESFTFSLLGALLVLPLVLRLHEDGPATEPGGVRRWLIALAAIAAIASLKVSTGYVLAAMAAFSAWSHYRTRWPAFAIIASLAAIMVVSQGFFAPRGFYISNWLILLSSYKQYVIPENLFTLVVPAACGLFLWFRPEVIRSAGIGSGDTQIELRLRPRRARGLLRDLLSLPRLRAQVVVAGAVAAYLPVFLLPIGSNAIYFSLMPHWLLLPLVAAAVCGMGDPIGGRSLPGPALAAVAILVLTTIPFLPVNLDLKGLRGFLAAVDRGSPGAPLMVEPQAMKKLLAGSFARTHGLFDSAFVDKLQRYPWTQRMREIAATAGSAGRRFAVFVPPSNRDFWNKLAGTGPYWCADMHLYIPSQTGALMIKGLQPLDQPCDMFAPGSPDYGEVSHSAETVDADLCRHAATLGVETVLVLNSVAEPTRNRTLSCIGSK